VKDYKAKRAKVGAEASQSEAVAATA
jgi:hypothetical protein